MDQRLVVTSSYVAHLAGGALLVVAYSLVDVTFTAKQLEFLFAFGYLGPTVALALIWAKNYRIGAPLYVATAAVACWFTAYFFLTQDNQANVWVATGEGVTAYLIAALAAVVVSLAAAGVGCWLWYRESDGFRSTVDSVVRPQ